MVVRSPEERLAAKGPNRSDAVMGLLRASRLAAPRRVGTAGFEHAPSLGADARTEEDAVFVDLRGHLVAVPRRRLKISEITTPTSAGAMSKPYTPR